MLKDLNLHPKCQTRVSKAVWLPQLHQGTLSVVAINVFKCPNIFLEPSCPWLQPNRQSTCRDRLIPKLSPRPSWSGVQTSRRTHWERNEVKQNMKYNVKSGKRKISPGGVKAVFKIPLAFRHVFDLMYLITLKTIAGTNENTRDTSRMKTYFYS